MVQESRITRGIKSNPASIGATRAIGARLVFLWRGR
jgi:hypothetical protein